MTFAAPRAPSTSAERTGAATHEALEAVRRAPSILDGIRRADDLLQAAREDPAGALPVLAEEIRRRDDHVAAIAAVHALAAVPGSRADTLLTALLDDEQWLREHTAGALADRAPLPRAAAHLADLVAGGGFPGMLAQRTLRAWAPAAPEAVGTALEHALAGAVAAGPRARLAETLGLVPGAGPAAQLRALAGSPGEDQDVRGAALEALVDRRQTGAESVADLADLAGACAHADGPLAAVARLALADLHAAVEPDPATGRDGLTVLQPFLHAEIDRDLTFSGRGDNGGIATLLAQLGDALSAPDSPGGVARVLTVSRGTHDEARAATARPAGAGHVFGVVPFTGPPVHMADAWPRRVAAERGLRRVLRRAGPVDVLHLRMADVGSMAAAAVAAELGIPWVLTLAPVPHALVAARERAAEQRRLAPEPAARPTAWSTCGSACACSPTLRRGRSTWCSSPARTWPGTPASCSTWTWTSPGGARWCRRASTWVPWTVPPRRCAPVPERTSRGSTPCSQPCPPPGADCRSWPRWAACTG